MASETPVVPYWITTGREWYADDKEAARRESAQINAIETRLDDGGWLSTLVWNMRNAYMAWPDSTFPARQVRTLVEGFLAEIERGAKVDHGE